MMEKLKGIYECMNCYKEFEILIILRGLSDDVDVFQKCPYCIHGVGELKYFAPADEELSELTDLSVAELIHRAIDKNIKGFKKMRKNKSVTIQKADDEKT
jgi:hypothetical protein